MRLTPKERLAELLFEAEGWDVDPDRIDCPRGFWAKQDVYRWEYWFFNARTHVFSWDTVTECARSGIVVEKHDDHQYEVIAKSSMVK